MGLGKKTIDDENYAGKRVLVRCDFNVPMKDGVITNENRINAALLTAQRLSCAAIWASRRMAPKPSSAWLPLLFA